MLSIFLTHLSLLHVLNFWGWVNNTQNCHHPPPPRSYLINKACSYSRVKWSILRANQWFVSSVKVTKAGSINSISLMCLQDTMLRPETKFNFTSKTGKLCFFLRKKNFFSESHTVCKFDINWTGSNVDNGILLSSPTTWIHTSQYWS
jgi:hypothetical protein